MPVGKAKASDRIDPRSRPPRPLPTDEVQRKILKDLQDVLELGNRWNGRAPILDDGVLEQHLREAVKPMKEDLIIWHNALLDRYANVREVPEDRRGNFDQYVEVPSYLQMQFTVIKKLPGLIARFTSAVVPKSRKLTTEKFLPELAECLDVLELSIPKSQRTAESQSSESQDSLAESQSSENQDSLAESRSSKRQDSLQVPGFESGKWVTVGESADRDGIKVSTLCVYRNEKRGGTKSLDGLFGIDKDGRKWRKPGPEMKTQYLLSSLRNQASLDQNH